MRESCKSGSVGEAAGDRRLYPTAWYRCRKRRKGQKARVQDSRRQGPKSASKQKFLSGRHAPTARLADYMPDELANDRGHEAVRRIDRIDAARGRLESGEHARNLAGGQVRRTRDRRVAQLGVPT